MMEEDTPISKVGIDVTQCYLIDQSECPVNDQQKESNMNKECAPMSKDKEPLNDPPNDSNLMEEETQIEKAGIDLTQCFQTDQLFDSREAAIEWCHEVARKNNTTVVIMRSNMNPSKRRAFVDIGCQRGNKKYYRANKKVTPDTRRRQTRESKKCGCPFSLRGIRLAENKWRIRVSCGRHNHEGDNSSVIYFNQGKEDEEQPVAELTSSGARPRQVLQAVKEKNKRSSLKRQEAKKLSVLEQVNMMDEDTPISKVGIDGTQCYQIDQCEGPVNDPQNESNMNKEDAPMSKVGGDVARYYQIDQDEEPVNLMEEDARIAKVGINLTQCFQTDQLFDSGECCPEVALKENCLVSAKTINNKRPSVMEHVNMMEDDTPMSRVGIEVTQCYQIDQCEGPVNDPQKENNMNKEDALMSKVGGNMTRCYQIDQDKEPPNDPPNDSNLMEEEVPIAKVGIDLTQCFQTDQLFDSREAAIEWCHEVSRKNNTTVVIMRSNMNPANRRAFVDIGCQRGNKKNYRSNKRNPVTPDTRKRRPRESKKCGCPFSLRGIRLAENKWRIRVSCGRHNHEGESISVPSFNRWKEDEEQLVAELTASGARPRQVLQALKEKNKECLVSSKALYNKRSSLKRQEADKTSVMEQVIKLSTQYHYMVWHRKDEKTNELKDIVWAYPESTLLAKCFPSVLMIDCTYKTNRFKVPFFHVAGVSSLGTPFTVAYAFIEEETEEHFSWALTQLKFLFMPNTLPSVCVMNGDHPLINAVRVVFPEAKRLICTLHIGESIVTNCRKEILDDEMWNHFYRDWECVLKAETKEALVDMYTGFVTTWVARYPTCITYVRDAWMVHKESFILAWTQKIKHFGYTEITTDESEHDQLRKYMESSSGTMGFFFRCWEMMHGIVVNQIKHIRASNEKSSSGISGKYEISAFEELNNFVSHHALGLIQFELNQSAGIEVKNHVAQHASDLRQLEYSQSTDVNFRVTSCSCLIGYTHGLPCVHEVLHYSQEGRPIPLSAIDQQWKQLSMVLNVDNDFEFVSQPEVRLLHQRWMEASESDRRLMEEKMREVLLSWDS